MQLGTLQRLCHREHARVQGVASQPRGEGVLTGRGSLALADLQGRTWQDAWPSGSGRRRMHCSSCVHPACSLDKQMTSVPREQTETQPARRRLRPGRAACQAAQELELSAPRRHPPASPQPGEAERGGEERIPPTTERNRAKATPGLFIQPLGLALGDGGGQRELTRPERDTAVQQADAGAGGAGPDTGLGSQVHGAGGKAEGAKQRE